MSEPPMLPMAGDELDATIARVVFGADVYCPERYLWFSRTEIQDPDYPVGRGNPRLGHPGEFHIPAYSTDMAAAWLVVERLTAVWPWVNVQFAINRWEAEVWANAGILREAFHAAADTAPLAICRLALRALPVGQEPR